MTAMQSYKSHFSRFLSAAPERIHLAAHSHHLWPDVSFDAHCRAWSDAAVLADRKWEHIFGTLWPSAQRHVARLIGLSDPGSVVFGPNTHDFLLRILSCMDDRREPLSVLATDGEFHSFTRQMARLEETGAVSVARVPVEPFDSFAARYADAAAAGGHDLVFFSHVFFNSGFQVPAPEAIVAAVAHPDTFIVIDGYHAFMALPVDIGAVADRVFYIGGGYKYAMTGEGACFLHVPPGYGPHPTNTGWYAAFSALSHPGQSTVAYPADGQRFIGSTFDQTALYRFVAVMDWAVEQGLTPAAIHERGHLLQRAFAEALDAHAIAGLGSDSLVVPLDQPSRGQFLVYRTPQAAEMNARLLKAGIVTDCRGDRLRFGFGVYHDLADMPLYASKISEVLG